MKASNLPLSSCIDLKTMDMPPVTKKKNVGIFDHQLNGNGQRKRAKLNSAVPKPITPKPNMFTKPSNSASTNKKPLILRKMVGATDSILKNIMLNNKYYRREYLRFVLLGCESMPPYGPIDHTAKLFLEFIAKALQKVLYDITKADTKNDNGETSGKKKDTNKSKNKTKQGASGTDNGVVVLYEVSIRIFNCQKFEYPHKEEWDLYDGVLIAGSYASANENDLWVLRLKDMIQKEVVCHKRKTLGISFGHQLIAQSFNLTSSASKFRHPFCDELKQQDTKNNDSNCEKDSSDNNENDGCSHETSGRCNENSITCAGRQTMQTTKEGKYLLNGLSELDFFYTYRDMVDKLPPAALSLGGSSSVPIQSVAYFESEADKVLFSENLNNADNGATIQKQEHESNDILAKVNSSRIGGLNSHLTLPNPYMITFQAHPELSASEDIGFKQTFVELLKKIESNGFMTPKQCEQAQSDCLEHFKAVQSSNIGSMANFGKILGWFPTEHVYSKLAKPLSEGCLQFVSPLSSMGIRNTKFKGSSSTQNWSSYPVDVGSRKKIAKLRACGMSKASSCPFISQKANPLDTKKPRKPSGLR